ncbi:unnamed protein product [Urochloa humidicola]
MAASPEFYKPCASPLPPSAASVQDEGSYYCYSNSSCRTPTGSGIKEPTTCPPAPRKPPAPLCKKRLFQPQPVISLRLDELERIFRPHPKPDKRRCGAKPKKEQQQQQLGLN